MAWTSATPWLTKETRSDGRVKLSKVKTRAIQALARPCCKCCQRRHVVSRVCATTCTKSSCLSSVWFARKASMPASTAIACTRRPLAITHASRSTPSAQRSPCAAAPYSTAPLARRRDARCDRHSARMAAHVSALVRPLAAITAAHLRSDSPQRWVPMAPECNAEVFRANALRVLFPTLRGLQAHGAHV